MKRKETMLLSGLTQTQLEKFEEFCEKQPMQYLGHKSVGLPFSFLSEYKSKCKARLMQENGEAWECSRQTLLELKRVMDKDCVAEWKNLDPSEKRKYHMKDSDHMISFSFKKLQMQINKEGPTPSSLGYPSGPLKDKKELNKEISTLWKSLTFEQRIEYDRTDRPASSFSEDFGQAYKRSRETDPISRTPIERLRDFSQKKEAAWAALTDVERFEYRIKDYRYQCLRKFILISEDISCEVAVSALSLPPYVPEANESRPCPCAKHYRERQKKRQEEDPKDTNNDDSD